MAFRWWHHKVFSPISSIFFCQFYFLSACIEVVRGLCLQKASPWFASICTLYSLCSELHILWIFPWVTNCNGMLLSRWCNLRLTVELFNEVKFDCQVEPFVSVANGSGIQKFWILPQIGVTGLSCKFCRYWSDEIWIELSTLAPCHKFRRYLYLKPTKPWYNSCSYRVFFLTGPPLKSLSV